MNTFTLNGNTVGSEDRDIKEFPTINIVLMIKIPWYQYQFLIIAKKIRTYKPGSPREWKCKFQTRRNAKIEGSGKEREKGKTLLLNLNLNICTRDHLPIDKNYLIRSRLEYRLLISEDYFRMALQAAIIFILSHIRNTFFSPHHFSSILYGKIFFDIFDMNRIIVRSGVGLAGRQKSIAVG